ncbi:MAG TPA: hypothetical protein VNW92_26520 [Polyangiaceae bacterium]|jgi:hypothetical protein|nr:hypothetical protein [Polyangiaceae bacterium]
MPRDSEPAPERRAIGVARVLRAVVAVLGRPVHLNALALSVALGIPAAILFSSNGLRATDIVALLHRSWRARCLLWAGWLALSAPALSVLFSAPGTNTLRALRLPRAPLLGSLFLLAVLIELPWAVLFARGAGASAAWAALTLAVALAASSSAALRRRRWLVWFVLGGVFVAADPPAALAGLCGSLWALYALHVAFRCAPEEPGLRLRLLRPSHPFLALYLAHLLRLARAARSRLLVALVSGATGGIGLWFSLRNDPTERPLPRALAALALPLTLAAAACVAPVLESEARLRALLRSLRVSRGLVLSAFLLAIATPSSALATTTGAAASTACRASAAGLAAALLAWALTLSCAVAAWGRLLERRGRRTAGTFAAGVTLIATLALFTAYSW